MFSGEFAAARRFVARLSQSVFCAALGACVTEHAVFELSPRSSAAGSGVQVSMAGGPADAAPPADGSAAVGGSGGGEPPAEAADGGVPVGGAPAAARFTDLAPMFGAPLVAASPLSPPAPAGWAWYEIEGAT